MTPAVSDFEKLGRKVQSGLSSASLKTRRVGSNSSRLPHLFHARVTSFTDVRARLKRCVSTSGLLSRVIIPQPISLQLNLVNCVSN